MNDYNFSYEFPENYKAIVVSMLKGNGGSDIADAVLKCTFESRDLGLAYYIGMRGDNWNKRGMDITIAGPQSTLDYLKSQEKRLSQIMEVALRPEDTGFLLHEIFYFPNEAYEKIDLPEESEESFEVLSRDISDALAKGEPVLVLDRLHTYSTRYLRRLCEKHGLSISDGDNYPLQSLAGNLAKFYVNDNYFESEFPARAIKISISEFDAFNKIRNDMSYAHDNDVLNKAEAAYVVKVVAATLTFIHALEDQW